MTKANAINASLTAYSALVGGSGNGAIVSVGPPGGFAMLESQGAGSNPTTVSLQYVVRKVFTTSGTYTPTSGMVSCFIECVGSGGSGGGSVTATGAGVMSGGMGAQGGCIARGTFTSTQIGASTVVTIGAAVSGVTSGSGKSGNTSSVGILILSGGTSTAAGTATNRVTKALCDFSANNNGSGGSILVNGSGLGAQCCVYNSSDSLQFAFGGVGGGGWYGGGGAQVMTTTAATELTGGSATSYGGGSAGGCSTAGAASACTSGTSGAGIVVITEFIGT